MTVNLETDQSAQKARVFFVVVIVLLCGLAYENSREGEAIVLVETTSATANFSAHHSANYSARGSAERAPASIDAARSLPIDAASGSAL